MISSLKCLLFELSAVFGLHILKLWNIFDGSVELLTAALLVVVGVVVAITLVDAGLLIAAPPNIDDSALALAKLNPIDEVGVDDGTVANVAVTGVAAAVDDGGVVSAVPNAAVIAGEAIVFEVISDPGCT